MLSSSVGAGVMVERVIEELTRLLDAGDVDGYAARRPDETAVVVLEPRAD